MWIPAYIGIGSNLAEPQLQIARAFDALASIPSTHLLARSSLYRSSPLGPQDQPWFVNAVAGVLTTLDAPTLLSHLKRLELELGREPTTLRWGPRVIDFDLLVFGVQQINNDSLQVPHPGVAVRNFVLYPLADIAPDLEVPGVGRVSRLLTRVERGDLSLVA